MHKLYRNRYPHTLDAHDYRTTKWSEYIRVQVNKDDIWDSLFDMQGLRCAYCECEMQTYYKGHVEHFVRRDHDARLTFNWDNLFGSCRRGDGCGFYKDNQKYEIHDLLKLDVDEPDDFFIFLRDGGIILKSGLSRFNITRANETLRVFNLDALHGPLRQQRATAIKNQSPLINEIDNYLLNHGVDELLEEIVEDYLSVVKGLPFETALRHVVR